MDYPYFHKQADWYCRAIGSHCLARFGMAKPAAGPVEMFCRRRRWALHKAAWWVCHTDALTHAHTHTGRARRQGSAADALHCVGGNVAQWAGSSESAVYLSC